MRRMAVRYRAVRYGYQCCMGMNDNRVGCRCGAAVQYGRERRAQPTLFGMHYAIYKNCNHFENNFMHNDCNTH